MSAGFPANEPCYHLLPTTARLTDLLCLTQGWTKPLLTLLQTWPSAEGEIICGTGMQKPHFTTLQELFYSGTYLSARCSLVLWRKLLL